MPQRTAKIIHGSSTAFAVDDEVVRSVPGSCRELDNDVVVFCQLFDDMVSDHICIVRRSELNNRGGFSCSGCIVDGVLNNPSEAVRKALRVFNA